MIPDDRWHEPYMAPEELDGEIAAGVAFWGYEEDGALIGVMGIQPVGDVDLIRHAYVLPGASGTGVGRALLAASAEPDDARRMLVGTWAAADWAIRFYRRNGFELVRPSKRRSCSGPTGRSGSPDRDVGGAGNRLRGEG